VITTLRFVRSYFCRQLYILTLFCLTPTLTSSLLSNVYRNIRVGQEMAVGITRRFLHHVVAVLWLFMQVILAVVSPT
jgi:hypothetical protein